MKSKIQWTNQEDQYLRKNSDLNCRKKWVIISKLLNQKFQGRIRSPKQCRERFINFSSQQVNNQWGEPEESLFFQLYDKQGPKWSKIAENFHGKSQNNIKNKFYSTLRRFVRNINKVRKQHFKYNKKQIKFESVLRVLDAPQYLISLGQQLRQLSVKVRQKIIKIMREKNFEQFQSQIPQLISDINNFNLFSRSYRIHKNKNFKEKNTLESRENQFKEFSELDQWFKYCTQQSSLKQSQNVQLYELKQIQLQPQNIGYGQEIQCSCGSYFFNEQLSLQNIDNIKKFKNQDTFIQLQLENQPLLDLRKSN